MRDGRLDEPDVVVADHDVDPGAQALVADLDERVLAELAGHQQRGRVLAVRGHDPHDADVAETVRGVAEVAGDEAARDQLLLGPAREPGPAAGVVDADRDVVGDEPVAPLDALATPRLVSSPPATGADSARHPR